VVGVRTAVLCHGADSMHSFTLLLDVGQPTHHLTRPVLPTVTTACIHTLLLTCSHRENFAAANANTKMHFVDRCAAEY